MSEERKKKLAVARIQADIHTKFILFDRCDIRIMELEEDMDREQEKKRKAMEELDDLLLGAEEMGVDTTAYRDRQKGVNIDG